MSRLRCQVILPAASEKTEDDIMNVFHFQTVSPADESNYVGLANAVQSFYANIGDHIANHRKNFIRLRFFDLADPSPRAPVFEDTRGLSVSAGNYLPNEIAVVLSLYAAETSGVPRGRRRGRLYIGPLKNNTFTIDAVGRVAPEMRSDLLAAANALADATNGSFPSPGGWQLYSPTDDIMRQVVRVSVDDAPDIQRRRGIDASVRDLSDVATGP